MKKIKSTLSIFLCAIVLLSCCVLAVNADDTQAYPESEHYYQNNYYNEWVYTYPEDVEGLFITFAQGTNVEIGDEYDIYFENDDIIDVSDIFNENTYYKVGDYISIFDSNNNLVGNYQGDLSGKTIYVPNSSFKISLTTDSSVTEYGF